MQNAAPSGKSGTAMIDSHLVARMTGQLGDRQTTEQRTSAIAQALCEPLVAAFARLGIENVRVERGDVELGMRGALLSDIEADDALCDAAIAGWCPDVSIAVPGRFVIGFVEALLGGTPPVDEPRRAPSEIERHTSIVFFEQVNDALKGVVGMPMAVSSTGEPVLGKPDLKAAHAAEVHAVRMRLTISVGPMTAPVTVILPQATVIKTSLALARPQAPASATARPRWAERLERQISRADVTLKARVKLTPMTLDALSRLKPGDVLPFADERDVRVELEANGRTIHVCELGRSGSRYMLRLKAPEGLDDALADDLAP